MLSPEFNQVYDEAFLSLTGEGTEEPRLAFTDVGMQEAFKEFEERNINALINHWTSPDYDKLGPVTKLHSFGRDSLLRIRHPSVEEFDEQDAATIAKIRFLGGTAITFASAAIALNRDLKITHEKRFSSRAWHRFHPTVDKVFALGYEQDAASPVRVMDWPRGKYLNCLGISIAASGESENEKIPYRYMNRIRNNDFETKSGFSKLFDHIYHIAPTAMQTESILHVADLFETTANLNRTLKQVEKSARCLIIEKLEHVFDDGFDEQFHHAVLRSDEKATWRQFDPYALIDRDLPKHFGAWLAYESVGEDSAATSNELLLLDSSNSQQGFEQLTAIVKLAANDTKRLASIATDYKSPTLFDDIRKELLRQQALYYRVTHPKNNAPMYKRFSDELSQAEQEVVNKKCQAIWLAILSQTAKDRKTQLSLFDSLGFKVDELTEANRRKVAARILDPNTTKDYEKTFHETIKQNTPLRNEFIQNITNLPYASCFRYLEGWVEVNAFSGNGVFDQTMEIGDPAFMVGSMYLNHYANFRKDGKVNIASEIARVNPSQLIWQSAVSNEGNATLDPRIRALGSLVKSLKHDQQHPLVRSTHFKKG